MLEREREALVAAGGQLAAAGLVIGSSGNLSARSGNLVLVTPSGLSIAGLEPTQVTVIDLDGNVVEGDLPPTSEVPLHLAVYRATKAQAIAHTHALASTAVSVTSNELPALHYTCLELGGPVRVAPYATFGTQQLADNVIAALDGRNAALMANHGSVAYGRTIGQAADRLQHLEWLCELHLRAVQLGMPQVLSERELNDAAAQYRRLHYGRAPGPKRRSGPARPRTAPPRPGGSNHDGT